jgi:hypothetical protein
MSRISTRDLNLEIPQTTTLSLRKLSDSLGCSLENTSFTISQFLNC